MHDFKDVTIQKILSCFVVIEEAGDTSSFYPPLILQNYYAAGFGLAQFPWSTCPGYGWLLLTDSSSFRLLSISILVCENSLLPCSPVAAAAQAVSTQGPFVSTCSSPETRECLAARCLHVVLVCSPHRGERIFIFVPSLVSSTLCLDFRFSFRLLVFFSFYYLAELAWSSWRSCSFSKYCAAVPGPPRSFATKRASLSVPFM